MMSSHASGIAAKQVFPEMSTGLPELDAVFTVNLASASDYRVNVLQCRPFQARGDLVSPPQPKNLDPARVVLRTRARRLTRHALLQRPRRI
jgi:hypothetical protein